MKNNIKISIIMGVYNPKSKEKYYKSVRSIIGQSFKDWELIIYDDGSSEEYADIIKEVTGLDNRIIYFRGKVNKGLSYALNYCIEVSKGKYIARMDDDDISDCNRLKKQFDFLENNIRYQWVGSNAEIIDTSGVWGIRMVPEVPKKKDFLFNSPFIHPSIMFRKKILLENGGYSCAKEHLSCEDYELFIRLYKNGNKGYNIQEPLVRYWEDYDSYKKRTYSRRIREMRLRYYSFKDMNMLNIYNFVYIIKPLIVGIIPKRLYFYIKRSKDKI